MSTTIMKTGITAKVLALLMALALVASSIFLSGCPDRVTGEQTANQKPVVYFVNVPPTGFNTSRNPILYWVGTDPDGQVKMFRYAVVLVSDMGGATPEAYASTTLKDLPDSRWTYLPVNDSTPNPQAKAIVKMSASLTDPVNEKIPQYVFLQAFDEDNLGSDIAFRLYTRNDNPPQTSIRTLDYSYPDNPFINAAQEGGVITGVRLSWGGEDKLDYPSDVPPFEYQWKLFGPYTTDSVTGGEYKQLLDQFVVKVFVANDGKMYRVGQGETIVFYCDTLDTVAEPDTIVHFACDTLFIDEVTGSSSYGTLDSMLLIDETFMASPLFRLVDSSKSENGDGWISNTGDTLYDVYSALPVDSTTERRFLFWARCRDDANVPDLVPNLMQFNVIEPKYERDILLINFMKVFRRYNAPYRDSVFTYWQERIHEWRPSIQFDTSDHHLLNFVTNGDDIPLAKLLRYKLVILYNDDVRRSDIIGNSGPSRAALKIYKAIDAGVNVWLTMRSPGRSGEQSNPATITELPEIPDQQYQRYFGVSAFIYSGWWYYAFQTPSMRIEDFVGAYSLKKPQFPDLAVDTALLHRRYEWRGTVTVSPAELRDKLMWMDTLASLPEVGWASRHFGTEPLYLYKSRYGASHPLGANSSYEGSPVAIRYGTNLFRTAHFSFTMTSIQDDQAQVVVNNILTWLYPEAPPSAPTTIDRYSGAAVRLSAESVRRNDSERAETIKQLAGTRSRMSDIE